MATVNEFFPSNYIRAADLGGKEIVVTIDRVETDVFENDGKKQIKPVVHFRDTGIKPLVTNKTNFLLIAAACGDDTEQWPGKQVCLYPDMVAFKGKVAEAIRVKRPAQAQPAAEAYAEASGAVTPPMANPPHQAAAAAQTPFSNAPASTETQPFSETIGDKIPF